MDLIMLGHNAERDVDMKAVVEEAKELKFETLYGGN